MELIPDKTAFIQLKTEYRGVTYLWVRPKKGFMPWHPIMDDGDIILVAKSEEIVHRAEIGNLECRLTEDANRLTYSEL